jgi:hypothetical protein
MRFWRLAGYGHLVHHVCRVATSRETLCLAVGLSPLFPESLMLGMEIRTKVTEYVRLRIQGLREQEPG